MRVVPDNAHCMKHACSYPLDKECPYCANARLVREIVRDHVDSQWPHRNRVTMPELMRALEEDE